MQSGGSMGWRKEARAAAPRCACAAQKTGLEVREDREAAGAGSGMGAASGGCVLGPPTRTWQAGGDGSGRAQFKKRREKEKKNRCSDPCSVHTVRTLEDEGARGGVTATSRS